MSREPSAFRWAIFPRSCVRFPLEKPFRLRTVITADAPGRVKGQVMTVTVDGKPIQRSVLGREWMQIPVALDASVLVPGENTLCLELSKHLPGHDRDAAAVARLQLP